MNEPPRAMATTGGGDDWTGRYSVPKPSLSRKYGGRKTYLHLVLHPEVVVLDVFVHAEVHADLRRQTQTAREPKPGTERFSIVRRASKRTSTDKTNDPRVGEIGAKIKLPQHTWDACRVSTGEGKCLLLCIYIMSSID